MILAVKILYVQNRNDNRKGTPSSFTACISLSLSTVYYYYMPYTVIYMTYIPYLIIITYYCTLRIYDYYIIILVLNIIIVVFVSCRVVSCRASRLVSCRLVYMSAHLYLMLYVSSAHLSACCLLCPSICMSPVFPLLCLSAHEYYYYYYYLNI